MDAKYFRMIDEKPDINGIIECSDILRSGGIVVFPTETVYGVGANVFDDRGIDRIYKAKCRPRDKALLCHLCSVEQANEIGYLNETAKALINAFTPGPLTVIVKKKSVVSDNVTSGMDTVGLRFPSNNIFLELSKRCGFPIAATSANISGGISPAAAKQAIDELGSKVDAIIDSGITSIGTPSTIISLANDRPELLRLGSITEEMIKEVIGAW